jgi:RNA polymerase sigma-70 factor (ECF subfamily)
VQATGDEQDLICRAQRSDLGAFNLLVVRYQQLAYNVAYRLLGDGEAAADVTQEAFTSAYQAVRSFRGGSFKAWLLRIVTNGCYDHLRARQRHPTSSLESMTEDEERPVEFSDPGETPEDVVLRRELLASVQEGLLTLPVDQRLAVILYDVQGLSYDEIAQATRASLGTVKSRLSRGRAHLRAFLTGRSGELLPSRYRPRSRLESGGAG